MWRFPSFWKMLGAFFVYVSVPVAALLAVWLLVGCASPKIEYRPIPAMLVPTAPDLPKIPAADLASLSDETYLKLATRDRLLRLYADELRALLEPKP